MMSLRIAVVSLWAEDVPTCARFYKEVIGLPHLYHHAGHPHFKLGDTFLVILEGKPVPAQNPVPERFPLFAIAVDDLETAIERLEAQGVALPWGIEEDSGSRWVMFHDPAGNLIELVSFKG